MYAKVMRRACLDVLRPRLTRHKKDDSAWEELGPGMKRAARLTLKVDYGVESPTAVQIHALIRKTIAEAKCIYLESLIDS